MTKKLLALVAALVLLAPGGLEAQRPTRVGNWLLVTSSDPMSDEVSGSAGLVHDDSSTRDIYPSRIVVICTEEDGWSVIWSQVGILNSGRVGYRFGSELAEEGLWEVFSDGQSVGFGDSMPSAMGEAPASDFLARLARADRLVLRADTFTGRSTVTFSRTLRGTDEMLQRLASTCNIPVPT